MPFLSQRIILVALLLIGCCCAYWSGCDYASPCDSAQCPPNAECLISATGNADCQCKPGYVASGDTCRYEPCSLLECQNGGTCLVDSTAKAYCQCTDEYTGTNCERYNSCYGYSCGDHGTCQMDASGNPSCLCDDGYVGPNCLPDPCLNFVCPYINNVCDNAQCLCIEGYEGDTCGIAIRDKYIGTFTAIDSCISPVNFMVTITADPDSIGRFVINNFANKGTNAKVKAKVLTQQNTTSKIFTIPRQSVGNIIVEGTAQGYINATASTVVVLYQSSLGTTVDSCRLQLNRQ